MEMEYDFLITAGILLYIAITLAIILGCWWFLKYRLKYRPRNMAKDKIDGVKEQVSCFEKYRKKDDI